MSLFAKWRGYTTRSLLALVSTSFDVE